MPVPHRSTEPGRPLAEMHPTHWLIPTQAGAPDAVLPRQRLHLFFGDAHVHLRDLFYSYTNRILLPERERVDALERGQAAGHELLEVGEPAAVRARRPAAHEVLLREEHALVLPVLGRDFGGPRPN